MLVEHFRTILVWPLRLHRNDQPDYESDGNVEPWASQIEPTCGQWRRVHDLYQREATQDASTSYAEFNFFLPQVQRFLYPREHDDPRLALFERTDITSLQVWFDNTSPANIELRCLRMHLYLFATGVSVMVVELAADKLGLAVVQRFRELFRRAYPPYYGRTPDENTHFPARVAWHTSDGEVLAEPDQDPKRWDDCVRAKRHPVMPLHWQAILRPLKFFYGDGSTNVSLCYSHLAYEQIPSLSYLAVSSPADLTRSDHVRVAFAQQLDALGCLPYSEPFLRSFEKRYCYDRYWDIRDPDRMCTRYYCCEYAFTVIGPPSPFFLDAASGVLSHFRHHYFQIALLAHFQQSSLLNLADCALRWREDTQGQASSLRSLQQQLVRFNSEFWFPQVSTQEQGGEIYGLYRKHLQVRQHLSQVTDRVRVLNDFVDTQEEQRMTMATVRLTVVATVGLALSLATGFWGMNVIDRGGFPWIAQATSTNVSEYWRVMGAFVVSCLLALVLLVVVARGWQQITWLFGVDRDRRSSGGSSHRLRKKPTV